MSDIEIQRKAMAKKAAKAAPAKKTVKKATTARKTTAARSGTPLRQPDQRLSDARIEQEIQGAQSAIVQLQQQIAALEELRRGRERADKTVAKAPKAKATKKATVKKPPIVRLAPKKR